MEKLATLLSKDGYTVKNTSNKLEVLLPNGVGYHTIIDKTYDYEINPEREYSIIKSIIAEIMYS